MSNVTLSCKLTGLSLLLVVSVNCYATHFQFSGNGSHATLTAQPLRTNALVNPVHIDFNLSGIDVNKDRDGFDAVTVTGLEPMEQPGRPDLYTNGTLLAVPSGYEPVLTLENRQTQELIGVNVRPSQRKFRCDCEKSRTFAFDSSLYQSNVLFPTTFARLEEVGKMQNVRLVRVAIDPIQMDMKNRSLIVTTQMSMRVDFKRATNAIQTAVPKGIHSIIETMTVNGRDLGAVVRVAAKEKMLVVTADALKNSVQPLVDWKVKRGLDVDVVTLTEAGGTKEKVKTYIQKYYDGATVKPTYLLFVGNKKTMPAFSQDTDSGDAISDYNYALLAGNDKIPDVFYGRIIADNDAEVAHQVARSVKYEREPEEGATWYASAVTIASSEGANPSDKEYAEQVRAGLKAGTYTTFDAFLQGDDTATSENIAKSLKAGKSWLAYFGHGSGTSWGSTTTEFSNDEVDTLENSDRLPVIIDVACLNADWDGLATPFGKKWVTASKAGKETGAVAFYGGSVSISWHPPAIMSVGVAKYHFEKKVDSIGGSVMAGQMYLVEKKGTGDEVIDNIEWYNLFGDPSLVVRTK